MMKIIDAYLIREYLRLYAVFLLLFVGVFLLTDFFGSIRNLTATTRIWPLAAYYTLRAPYWATLLSPFAVILAILFAVGYLQGTRQLYALRIHGVSTRRIVTPLLITGLVTSLSILALDNTLVAIANRRAHTIQRHTFAGGSTVTTEQHIFISVAPDYLFYIRSFDPQRRLMSDVLVLDYTPTPTVFLCDEIRYEDRTWVIRGGTEHALTEPISSTRFTQRVLEDIAVPPEYFVQDHVPPGETDILTLHRRIEQYRSAGFPTQELVADVGFKLVYPFANLVLLVVAVPLGIIIRCRGRGASLGAGLLVSFGYYEAMALFRTLAKSGNFFPPLCPLIPNAVFLLAALYALSRVDRYVVR